MRILIDLQCAQGESGFRGIGKFSMEFAKALVQNRGQHEILISLNSSMPNIKKIKDEFKGLLDGEKFLIWTGIKDVSEINSNLNLTKVNEYIREFSFKNALPDVVVNCSVFEGFEDDVSSSIGSYIDDFLNVSIAYDLIPLIFKKQYLDCNRSYSEFYHRKLNFFKKSDIFLSISGHTKQDLKNVLSIPSEKVLNISANAGSNFKEINLRNTEVDYLKIKYKIKDKFIFYPCALDFRKNLEGLFKAYSKLPKEIRATHQLMLICKITDNQKGVLEEIIKRSELKLDEVIITGYVPENELVMLYNLGELLVFPSLYEGFGLPILEAMRCGTPVIGANVSSIPEVIGLKEALFDADSEESMANKIEMAITDDQFKKKLKDHIFNQEKKFSWGKSARLALEAFEKKLCQKKLDIIEVNQKRKEKLAYISPLPPEKSGISKYSYELIEELSNYFEIHLITDLKEKKGILKDFIFVSIEEFRKRYILYDHVLYNFGNSSFHSGMFALIEEVPGVVILHDFFLSGAINYLAQTNNDFSFFVKELFFSHGYQALKFLKENGLEETIFRFPINKRIIDCSCGVIVHSQYAKKLAENFYDQISDEKIKTETQIIKINNRKEKLQARIDLKLPEDIFLICCFGIIHKTKLNLDILDAFFKSNLKNEKKCRIVFVGCGGGSYLDVLNKKIKTYNFEEKVEISGWVDDIKYENYMAAADLAIQLRAFSRGETSRTVLECLAYGIPTIINSCGSFREFPDEVLIKLPESFEEEQLSKSIEELYFNQGRRKILSEKAQNYILCKHDPVKIGKNISQTIKSFSQRDPNSRFEKLLNQIALNEGNYLSEKEISIISQCISFNQKGKEKTQILIDITNLVNFDLKTGIERVTRSILEFFMIHYLGEMRVEPVYRDKNIYRYARNFTRRFLGLNEDIELTDFPIEVKRGDIFFGLELDILNFDKTYILKLNKERGLKIYFMVYDLLPILKPSFFPPNYYKEWLENFLDISDGAICISKSVANELRTYIKNKNLENFKISYTHLGADLDTSVPSQGVTKEESEISQQIHNREFFLMVGTIEPRKGYFQAIKAFEKLWKKGFNYKLVIVGKAGWMVDKVIKRINKNKEFGKKLIWFSKASDQLLLELYQRALVLIMASEGEGFGLPIIEAAKNRLPIIARDLPVFQEIAQEGAFYFSGLNEEDLSKAVEDWLDLYKKGTHPKSNKIKILNWKDVGENIIEILRDKNLETEKPKLVKSQENITPNCTDLLIGDIS